jgi:hypothetical protein
MSQQGPKGVMGQSGIEEDKKVKKGESRAQKGAKVVKRGQKGPKGAKRGQKGPKGAKRGKKGKKGKQGSNLIDRLLNYLILKINVSILKRGQRKPK